MYIQKCMKVYFLVGNLLGLSYAASFGSGLSSYSEMDFLSQQGMASAPSGLTLEPLNLEKSIDSNYIVGPGDFFDLHMESQKTTVQVSPDGNIVVSQLGVLHVAGQPLGVVIPKIQELLSRRYLAKECFVSFAKIKAFRIGIYGAVMAPGQHTLKGGERLSYLLREIGGVQGTANTDSILLIRNQDTTLIRFYSAELTGDQAGDPYLQQGDLFYVPEFPKATKVIHVRLSGQGRTLPWIENATADIYLQRSGLLRGSKSAFTHLNVLDAGSNFATRVPITETTQYIPQPGHILEPVGDAGMVHIGGAVARMGSMPYNPAWTPYEYVANSGLSYVSASYGRFRVVHKDGKEEWMDPVKGVIQPGDFIEIPRNSYEEVKDVALFLASIIGVLSTTILVYVTWKSTGK